MYDDTGAVSFLSGACNNCLPDRWSAFDYNIGSSSRGMLKCAHLLRQICAVSTECNRSYFVGC